MISRISNSLGSVIARLGLIFGALAAMTTAAIVVAWLVFQSIASNMAILSDEHLPELKASAKVVATTDAVRDILLGVLVAESTTELDRLADAMQTTLRAMRKNVVAGGPTENEGLSSLVDEVENSLVDLTTARKDTLQSRTSVAEKIKNALRLATGATGILASASDAAFAELVEGGTTRSSLLTPA